MHYYNNKSNHNSDKMSDNLTRLDIERFYMDEQVAILNDASTKMFFTNIVVLIHMYETFYLPEIQRNHMGGAWSSKNNKDYIENVSNNEDIYGQVLLVKNYTNKSCEPYFHSSDPDLKYMIVDAYNRTSALVSYYNNEFRANGAYYKDIDKSKQDAFNRIEVSIKVYLKPREMSQISSLFMQYNNGVRIDASTNAKNQPENIMNELLIKHEFMTKCEKLIMKLFKLSGTTIKRFWRHHFGRLFKLYCLLYKGNCSIDDERFKEVLSETDDYALNTNDYIEKYKVDGTILQQFILLIEQFILVFNYITANDYCSIQCIFLAFLVDKRKEENVSLPPDEHARKFGYKIHMVHIRRDTLWHNRYYTIIPTDNDNKHVLDRRTGKPFENKVKYNVDDIRKKQDAYMSSLLSVVNIEVVSKVEYMEFAEQKRLPQKQEKRINVTELQRKKFFVIHDVKEDHKGTCIDCGETNVPIVIGHIFSYAVSKSNAQTNLVPICAGCNQSAATDGNLNQIKHQYKNHFHRTPTILEYMNTKLGKQFKTAYAKLCDIYGDPLSAPYI